MSRPKRLRNIQTPKRKRDAINRRVSNSRTDFFFGDAGTDDFDELAEYYQHMIDTLRYFPDAQETVIDFFSPDELRELPYDQLALVARKMDLVLDENMVDVPLYIAAEVLVTQMQIIDEKFYRNTT